MSCSNNNQNNIKQILFDYKIHLGVQWWGKQFGREETKEKEFIWVLIFCEYCLPNGVTNLTIFPQGIYK